MEKDQMGVAASYRSQSSKGRRPGGIVKQWLWALNPLLSPASYRFLFQLCFCFICHVFTLASLLLRCFTSFPYHSNISSQSPHHSLTYCSGLSAREAGKEWDLFFSAASTHSLSSPTSLLFYLLHDRSEINHLPRCAHCVCLCACLCARAAQTSEDFYRVVIAAWLWVRPEDYHPVFWVNVCIINASGCDLHTLLSAWFMLSPFHRVFPVFYSFSFLTFFSLCTQDAFLLVIGPECVRSSLSMCLRFKVSHSSCLLSLVSVKQFLSHAETCPFGPFLSAIKN